LSFAPPRSEAPAPAIGWDGSYWEGRVQSLASGDLVAALRSIDDGDTYAHCVRVGGLTVAIARRMGVESTERAYEAGLYHDLGKIAVPLPVLLKPGKLDEEERALIELHAEESARLLRAAGRHQLAGLVAEHHERLDGSGYPYGRREDELCLTGQIVGVADVYDALTSDRPYRPALSRRAAIEIMHKQAGAQLANRIVEALEDVLESEPMVEPAAKLAAALALLGPAMSDDYYTAYSMENA
jgi:putative nucleotidyltransferase with HDIG domain